MKNHMPFETDPTQDEAGIAERRCGSMRLLKEPCALLCRLLMLSLMACAAAPAGEPDSSSALFQMREAERNFARESVTRGRAAAFVDNLADGSIIFTTSWISNGRQFWKNKKQNAVVLKWEPEFMDISASGDFGISTGPWEAQEYRPYTDRIATGYFLSVWKKRADGVWKVILDAGSSAPAMMSYQHGFSFPDNADKPAPHGKRVNADAVRKELTGRETRFSREWEKDPSPAIYASYLAPRVRLQREGHAPSSDADSVRAWIAQLPKSLAWTCKGAGAASSGDIGFTYGVLELRDAKKHPLGHYVRIWKKSPGREWSIVLDMLNLE
jgi:ketosteroid isomerase-like protein